MKSTRSSRTVSRQISKVAASRSSDDHAPARLTAAGTVLATLEFVGSDRKRTLSEVIKYLRRPKSTVLRVLDTLVRSGFVHRVAAGEYAVTLKAWRVGSQALAGIDLDSRIVPVVRRIAQETGEAALFAIYEDGFAVYVEKADSTQPVATFVSIGTRAPAHATATGKVLLAFQTEEEITRVIGKAKPCTPYTHVDRNALRRELADIRHTHLSLSLGEWREEVAGVGAPVFDRGGRVVGALGITCPRNRAEERLEFLGQLVRKVARETSIGLGAPPSLFLVSTAQADNALATPQRKRVMRSRS